MKTSLLSQTPTSTHSPTSFREAWSLYKQSRAVFGGRTPESSAFISAAKAAFHQAAAPSWRDASARTEFVQMGHGRPSARDGWAMECREVGINGVVVALFHHPVKGWALTWWE